MGFAKKPHSPHETRRILSGREGLHLDLIPRGGGESLEFDAMGKEAAEDVVGNIVCGTRERRGQFVIIAVESFHAEAEMHEKVTLSELMAANAYEAIHDLPQWAD